MVALADNRYQGIVPVPELIGNGDDIFEIAQRQATQVHRTKLPLIGNAY